MRFGVKLRSSCAYASYIGEPFGIPSHDVQFEYSGVETIHV